MIKDYLSCGDELELVLVYDNDEKETNHFIEPKLIVPDDFDIDEVRDFSLILGRAISYEIYKQSYRPVKEFIIRIKTNA